MAVIVEQGKINKGGIVLSKPLPLPEGTEVRIQIEPIDTHNTSTATDASEDFTNLPCFGMWADRTEMRDSNTPLGRRELRFPTVKNTTIHKG